jgi:NADH-quinone oxidoreductase subunit K
MLLNEFLMLAGALFCIGVYGVLARRNAVLVLMSIELMLNAANINFAAFGRMWQASLPNPPPTGEAFALISIAVAAAEAAVGLAIFVLLFRLREGIDVDKADLLRW